MKDPATANFKAYLAARKNAPRDSARCGCEETNPHPVTLPLFGPRSLPVGDGALTAAHIAGRCLHYLNWRGSPTDRNRHLEQPYRRQGRWRRHLAGRRPDVGHVVLYSREAGRADARNMRCGEHLEPQSPIVVPKRRQRNDEVDAVRNKARGSHCRGARVGIAAPRRRRSLVDILLDDHVGSVEVARGIDDEVVSTVAASLTHPESTPGLPVAAFSSVSNARLTTVVMALNVPGANRTLILRLPWSTLSVAEIRSGNGGVPPPAEESPLASVTVPTSTATLNDELVTLVTLGAEATSVNPVPATSIVRSPNVATPVKSVSWVSVPETVPPEGLLPMAIVIGRFGITAPCPFCALTRTGCSVDCPMGVLTDVSVGCVVKVRNGESLNTSGGTLTPASASTVFTAWGRAANSTLVSGSLASMNVRVVGSNATSTVYTVSPGWRWMVVFWTLSGGGLFRFDADVVVGDVDEDLRVADQTELAIVLARLSCRACRR